MLNTKEYFNQLETTLAVQELDNETAAAIQGGYDLQVYKHNPKGVLLGDLNGDRASLSSNANDEISLVVVKAGRWTFYEHANYNKRRFLPDSGKKWSVAQPGTYGVPSWLNDEISSFRRY